MAEPEHSVRDVVAAPGSLSFSADIGGRTAGVWLRTDADVTPATDAVLPFALIPAMLTGGRLRLDAPVSTRALRTQLEYQAIQRLWSRGWPFGFPPLEPVVVEAAEVRPAAPGADGVATFLSGGADSWWAALEHPEATTLVLIRGFDLRPEDVALVEATEARLRGAAAALGKRLVVVETNLRWDYTERFVPWELYYGTALAAVALALAPLVRRFLIVGASDYATAPPYGNHALCDHLWSTEALEIAHVGGAATRLDRLVRIKDEPVVRETLRVCWENPGGEYNCGRCRKCLTTMAVLDVLGVLGEFPTFPAALDVQALADSAAKREWHLEVLEEIAGLARARGRGDVGAAAERARARGRAALLDDDDAVSAAVADRDALAAKLAVIEGSRSWRVTAPVRAAAVRLRARSAPGEQTADPPAA